MDDSLPIQHKSGRQHKPGIDDGHKCRVKRVTKPMRELLRVIAWWQEKFGRDGLSFAYVHQDRLASMLNVLPQQIGRIARNLQQIGALRMIRVRDSAELQAEVERFEDSGVLRRSTGNWGNAYWVLCRPEDLDGLIDRPEPATRETTRGRRRRARREPRRKVQPPTLFDYGKTTSPVGAQTTSPVGQVATSPVGQVATSPVGQVVSSCTLIGVSSFKPQHHHGANGGGVNHDRKQIADALRAGGVFEHQIEPCLDCGLGLCLLAVAYAPDVASRNVPGMIWSMILRPANHGIHRPNEDLTDRFEGWRPPAATRFAAALRCSDAKLQSAIAADRRRAAEDQARAEDAARRDEDSRRREAAWSVLSAEDQARIRIEVAAARPMLIGARSLFDEACRVAAVELMRKRSGEPKLTTTGA